MIVHITTDDCDPHPLQSSAPLGPEYGVVWLLCSRTFVLVESREGLSADV